MAIPIEEVNKKVGSSLTFNAVIETLNQQTSCQEARIVLKLVTIYLHFNWEEFEI